MWNIIVNLPMFNKKIYNMETQNLTQEERVQEWYSQVSHSHILDSAVDALFNAIHDNMKKAGVPEDVWDDVFDLMNDDFSVSNS